MVGGGKISNSLSFLPIFSNLPNHNLTVSKLDENISNVKFEKRSQIGAYLIRYRIWFNSEKSFNNFTTLACV